MSRGPRAVLQMLSAVPIFSGCSAHELLSLASVGTALHAIPGEVLTSLSGRAAELFVVLSGSARREVDGGDAETLGSGDFFGEVSLFRGGPCAATVVAETPMELLVIDRRRLAAFLADAPSVADRISQSLDRHCP